MSQATTPMDSMYLANREFFAVIDKGGELNVGVQQCLKAIQMLDLSARLIGI